MSKKAKRVKIRTSSSEDTAAEQTEIEEGLRSVVEKEVALWVDSLGVKVGAFIAAALASVIAVGPLGAAIKGVGWLVTNAGLPISLSWSQSFSISALALLVGSLVFASKFRIHGAD